MSLVSLRKKDLSEETLESLGIDITYLHKSKFDPATLPALLKVIDRKQIDILHLHGYGATTFGRLAGAMRGIPTILHEHANLTDTPWFQKVADAALEPATDIAIAVSQSTADFVINARQMPPAKVKVVYLGVPLEEFSRTRTAEEIARRAQRARASRRTSSPIGTVTRLHDSKGNSYLVDAARLVLERAAAARGSSSSARGRCGRSSRRRRRRSASAIGSCSPASRATSPRVVSAFDLSVFPSLWEGTPLTVFEALAMGKPIVATDADGLLDVLTDERDAVIVPKRDARGAGRRASSG